MAAKKTYYIEQQAKNEREEIKDLIYLLTGKHILYEQAEEILNDYKSYLNKGYLSLTAYVWTRYGNNQ